VTVKIRFEAVPARTGQKQDQPEQVRNKTSQNRSDVESESFSFDLD